MDDKAIKTAFTEAVKELESATNARQFPDSITTTAALEYVDHDVVVSWAQAELGSRSPQQLLLDAFENLTDADATSVINCLLNETDTARKILATALREAVAKDLAYEAQKRVDNFDPTDEEMNRPIRPNDIDDPFLAEQRSFTASYNRSLRGK